MRRGHIRVGAAFALFTVFVFAAVADDSSPPKNQITLTPSGGVMVGEGEVESGFAGLSVAYTRFLGERFGIGLRPLLTVTGLGTPNPRPDFGLELFAEFRPFLAVHGLYAQAYLKSLAFGFGTDEPLAFELLVGGWRVGYDLPLGSIVGLKVGAGAEVTATPSGTAVQPTFEIGLSLSF